MKRLRRALKLVWQAAPLGAVTMVCLTLLGSVAPLGGLYFLKLAIDLLTSLHGAAGDGATGRLVLLLSCSGGLFVAQVLLRSASAYVAEALGLRVVEHTQELIAAQATAVPLAYYENAAYFDTLHLAQREAAPRLSRLVAAACQVVQGTFSLAAVGALLIFSAHWSIVVAAAVLAAPAIWLRMRNARALDQWQRNRSGLERRVSYYEWLLSATSAAKEARIFDLGRHFAGLAGELRRKLTGERLRFSRQRLSGEAISQGSAAFATTGIIAWLGLSALRGLASVGDVVMNYQAFQRGTAALQDFISGVASIYESQLFIGRLFDFLDLPLPVPSVVSPVAFPSPLREGIEFHGVTFTYPGARQPVLRDVSFRIEPGETIALVGDNGAGKTTLVKLLSGLYEPTDGSITIDGIDLREFDRRTLWNAFSVVFQDFGQYCAPAAENIRFGDLNGEADDMRITRAAREAGAHETIVALPDGYAQELGALFDGGQELSVGQWQKIALARAFYRNAPVVILDEPSSALDVRAEHEVFEKFRTLARGRTAVIISHRLSTVRMADRIFMLEDGQVAETGSHDDLVSEGGLYAGLFATQAGAYR